MQPAWQLWRNGFWTSSKIACPSMSWKPFSRYCNAPQDADCRIRWVKVNSLVIEEGRKADSLLVGEGKGVCSTLGMEGSPYGAQTYWKVLHVISNGQNHKIPFLSSKCHISKCDKASGGLCCSNAIFVRPSLRSELAACLHIKHGLDDRVMKAVWL